jgi:hypothetical protein
MDIKQRAIALNRIKQREEKLTRERLAEEGIFEIIAEYIYDADDDEVYSLTLLKVELFISGEPIDILPHLSPTQKAAVMETLSIY